jgi:hypothetical protein
MIVGQPLLAVFPNLSRLKGDSQEWLSNKNT